MTARPMMIVMTMIVLTVTEYGVVGAGSTIICYLNLRLWLGFTTAALVDGPNLKLSIPSKVVSGSPKTFAYNECNRCCQNP